VHSCPHQATLGLDKHFDSYQTYEEMSDKEIRALSKAFKALANPNRLQLFFNLLRETELNVEAGTGHDCFLAPLIRNLNIGAPTVSHHVKELVNADLIETERRGKQLVCTVNAAMVERLRRTFD
jgi:ArsR family transcriptional regulator, arsenate/arsenite/antimonite-responsive transcriptional repressor